MSDFSKWVIEELKFIREIQTDVIGILKGIYKDLDAFEIRIKKMENAWIELERRRQEFSDALKDSLP